MNSADPSANHASSTHNDWAALLVAANRIATALETIVDTVKIAGIGPENLHLISQMITTALSEPSTPSTVSAISSPGLPCSVLSTSPSLSPLAPASAPAPAPAPSAAPSAAPAPTPSAPPPSAPPLPPAPASLPATAVATAPHAALAAPAPAPEASQESHAASARPVPTYEEVKEALEDIESDISPTWYAVTAGIMPGVYYNLSEASSNVLGVSRGVYASHKTKEAALEAYKAAKGSVKFLRRT